MSRKWLVGWSVCLGLGLASGVLSGCLMQFVDGQSAFEEHQAEDDVASTIDSSMAALQCQNFAPVISCPVSIGGQTLTSTAYMIGFENAALSFIDPLILEVPANVVSATGTYNTGSGPSPLRIRQTNSFPVEPNRRITAEVNTTFLIVSVPPSVTAGLPPSGSPAPVFSYTLSFHQLYPLTATVPAVTVKPLQAGEVTVLWQTYYVPIFPCIADYAPNPFGALPAVTIPRAASPQDLTMTLSDLVQHGAHVSPCHFAVYDYTFAAPPPGLLFLPLIMR